MNRYDPTFDLNVDVVYACVIVTYISWDSDLALNLEDNLIYEHYTCGL